MKLFTVTVSAATAALSLLAIHAVSAEPNTLSDEEKSSGWVLLFDGTTTKGWTGIGKSEFPAVGWTVKDGALHHDKRGGGGDIVTAKSYQNFELSWEWKIGEAGNSGVKYNLPDPKKAVGFEYQMLDDARHSDAAKKSHQTAALYDLIEPGADRKTRPAGEWNQSRLLVDGAHVEQWLNGTKTVAFEIGSTELLALVGKSKYAKVPAFGIKTESPILLQDHGDEVDVRSIKIRVLQPK